MGVIEWSSGGREGDEIDREDGGEGADGWADKCEGLCLGRGPPVRVS